MARGPRYRVKYRRRREGKTNYYRRYKMALSRKLRAVVRKTLNHIIVQFVKMAPEGDYTIAAAHSIELVKGFGWRASTDNTPAAYLTGLLAGLRAKKENVDYAILDIGLHRPVKGARIFAALKGILDAGVEVPHNPEILPLEERLRGEHIASYAEQLKSRSLEVYTRHFSKYLKNSLPPEELPKHFEEVRGRIISSFKA